MKGKKVVYLIVALALPALIFVFLKYFGENQFEVEPLFPEGVSGIPVDCPEAPAGKPYRIPEKILLDLKWNPNDSLLLVYIGSSQHSNLLMRIVSNFESQKVQIVKILHASEPVNTSGEQGWVMVPDETLRQWINCFLFLKKPNDLVLVDHQRRIRGYYASQNRDEVDRLITEVAIILKHY
jgi:hypothetical protein